MAKKSYSYLKSKLEKVLSTRCCSSEINWFCSASSLWLYSLKCNLRKWSLSHSNLEKLSTL